MVTRVIETVVAVETKPDLLTGADLLALGDVGPCELIEGKIVTMSPTKIQPGHYEFQLAKVLDQFISQHNLGKMLVGEVGIYVERNPDTIRAADVLYISHQRLAQATPNDFLDIAPELVVEIMSPSDRWTGVRKKLRQYFACGVNVVLVVEPGEQLLSAFRSLTAVVEFGLADELVLEDILPGFRYRVADLFA